MTGQAGQDRRRGQGDRTDRTGPIGQGNRDGTAVAGQSRYGSWDRITETGQDMSICTRKLRQVSLGRTERTSQDVKATLGQQDTMEMIAGAGWLAQDSWHRTVGK